MNKRIQSGGYMFQEFKKILVVSSTVVMVSIVSAFAFDLEDYATTYRSTRDDYSNAQTKFKAAEAAYFKAFAARMSMEEAAREEQVKIAKVKIQEAIDNSDDAAKLDAENQQKDAEDALKKLAELKKSSEGCGM